MSDAEREHLLEIERNIKNKIFVARQNLPLINISKEQIAYLGAESIRGGCQGHNSDIAAARVAIASAAYRGSSCVDEQDLRLGVLLAILPRCTVPLLANNETEDDDVEARQGPEEESSSMRSEQRRGRSEDAPPMKQDENEDEISTDSGPASEEQSQPQRDSDGAAEEESNDWESEDETKTETTMPTGAVPKTFMFRVASTPVPTALTDVRF